MATEVPAHVNNEVARRTSLICELRSLLNNTLAPPISNCRLPTELLATIFDVLTTIMTLIFTMAHAIIVMCLAESTFRTFAVIGAVWL